MHVLTKSHVSCRRRGGTATGRGPVADAVVVQRRDNDAVADPVPGGERSDGRAGSIGGGDRSGPPRGDASPIERGDDGWLARCTSRSACRSAGPPAAPPRTPLSGRRSRRAAIRPTAGGTRETPEVAA